MILLIPGLLCDETVWRPMLAALPGAQVADLGRRGAGSRRVSGGPGDLTAAWRHFLQRYFPIFHLQDREDVTEHNQIANCYPLDALGEYRRWLQDTYLGAGKFKTYLKGKKEIPPSVAQLAIDRLSPELIEKE
jgi:hypothetical protein